MGICLIIKEISFLLLPSLLHLSSLGASDSVSQSGLMERHREQHQRHKSRGVLQDQEREPGQSRVARPLREAKLGPPVAHW